MTEKRKALGRGLESLLPRRPFSNVPGTAPSLSPTASEKGGAPAYPTLSPKAGDEGGAPSTTLLPGEAVQEIALDLLDANPYQTRAGINEEALEELRASIAAMGVIEPIIVRPNLEAAGRYQIIAGARRVKASSLCEKTTIPAIVRHISNQEAMVMTVVENLQREDLNPVDEARSYQRLGAEFGLTQDEVAACTGKDRSTIANHLRLLRLPEEVQELIRQGKLSLGHAKALLVMPASAAELMVELARKAAARALTVRQLEEAVARLIEARPAAKKERIVDPNVRAAEEALRRALGVRVMITDRKGKGRIVLTYKSLEDFDRIMQAVTGPEPGAGG